MRNGHSAQPRDGRDSAEEIFIKSSRRRTFISPGCSVHTEQQQVLAIVAEVYPAQVLETMDKQSRGNEKNHRKTYLSDDQALV